ncbi:unnamed protein product [Dracunculus medinensis]|uniref:Enkurin domain-containing protein n=1 Tax=Dracunculus medinensis TaxID=318479 RepID=A0A0N4UFK6_DRAME|nr:unnamed protein product [Dracunculus medinensis]
MENEICFQKSRYAYCKAKQISRKFDPPEFCEYTEQKRESFVEMKEKKFKNGHARSISSDNGDIYDPIQPTNGCIANGRFGNDDFSVPQITKFHIEKTKDTSSPIVEYKLAQLPQLEEYKVERMDAATLYLEQRAALKKTNSSCINKGSDIRRLDDKQLAKLNANRALLKQQQDELRSLGILP